MWLLFLVILLGTLRIAHAEPDNPASTYGDAADPGETDAETNDLANAEQLIACEIDGGATEGSNAFDAERELAAGSETREKEWLEGADARDASLRSRRSWLGRIDVGITWRRTFADVGPNRDEVFLVGTWRL